MSDTPQSSPQDLKTRGELESEITQSLLRVLKECLGRGPQDARTYLCDSMILIRCVIPLQAMERSMMTSSEIDGTQAVRTWRRSLLESCRGRLHADVEKILQVKIRSFFTDSNPTFEEAIIVFSLENKPSYRIGVESIAGMGKA